jgi:hypothetical protein
VIGLSSPVSSSGIQEVLIVIQLVLDRSFWCVSGTQPQSSSSVDVIIKKLKVKNYQP